MPTTQSPPARKDAARNRALLLQTAQNLFDSDGLSVSLKDVARAAGVGVGTVYRHFPTKDDLIAALFTEHLDREIDRARTTAESGDAWTALVDYLEETMRIQASSRGLRALLCPAGSVVPVVQQCKAVVDPYLEQVVNLAHEQGSLRPDCTARDIALLQVALVGIMDATGDQATEYQRHLHHFLAGVRA